MNILLITSQIPYPPIDGVKRSIYGLLKSLANKGHKIDLITYYKNTDFSKTDPILNNYCNLHIVDASTENNILGAFLNLVSPIPYNVSKYHHKRMKEAIQEILKSKKFDLVQIHNIHMGWLINVIKEMVDIPIILREENLEMMIMKRFAEQENNLLKKIFATIQFRKFIKYEPGLCGMFDECIMISENDKKELLNYNPYIVANSIPSGVEFENLNIKLTQKENFSLVHIGNLDWYPNLDSLQWMISEILPEIVSRFPGTKLYVYGGGNSHRLKINSEIKNYVIIKGFVANLWEEISNKSLAVVPLRIGSGIRIKILEMLAVGQPILTTEIGKEGINIVDEEHLLIANSKEEFIRKICNVFEGKYDFNQITQKGKLFVEENYSWNSIVLQFESVYNNLVYNQNTKINSEQ